ncbi:MAG: hypothetical protein ABIS50_18510 [Luteolibacter sp.]|uniref:hypothetical protein n=1 Tax=Luteolibacter sp. TaxID=1962973 RepID=UPI003265008F
MSEPLYQPRSDVAARLLGLGVFSAGAAVIWWQGVLPLQAAVAEKPLVEYSIKLVILGEFFVATGLFWMIRGLAGYTAVRTMQKSPKTMKVLAAAALAATLLSWWLLTHVFESYGYFNP